jgi:hypothetical protein
VVLRTLAARQRAEQVAKVSLVQALPPAVWQRVELVVLVLLARALPQAWLPQPELPRRRAFARLRAPADFPLVVGLKVWRRRRVEPVGPALREQPMAHSCLPPVRPSRAFVPPSLREQPPGPDCRRRVQLRYLYKQPPRKPRGKTWKFAWLFLTSIFRRMQ